MSYNVNVIMVSEKIDYFVTNLINLLIKWIVTSECLGEAFYRKLSIPYNTAQLCPGHQIYHTYYQGDTIVVASTYRTMYAWSDTISINYFKTCRIM